jgi:uncharacterized membrane protein
VLAPILPWTTSLAVGCAVGPHVLKGCARYQMAEAQFRRLLAESADAERTLLSHGLV